jgi:hypothetical protein
VQNERLAYDLKSNAPPAARSAPNPSAF